DPAKLRWLDPPPAPALASARDLLRRLGALDAAGRITPHGRRMAGLGVHPRLAHMLLRASDLELLGTAARLAALLSDRDLLRGRGPDRDADIAARVALLDGTSSDAPAPRVDRGALHRARRFAMELERTL